jgi:pimeloyl-ACP methyl ester carboxylesterase
VTTPIRPSPIPLPEGEGFIGSHRRKVFTGLLAVVAFFALRRFLLVVFLTAKILGYPGALNAWEGAVDRETVTHDGIPVDVYRGPNSSSPILIVHGVNPTGKNSLDLIRVSEGLAQIGYEVFVPDLAHLKKQHLRPEDAASVRSVFQFIGRNAGIACFSYGCGPALIAASHADIRDKVRFAVDFGGYYDIRELLEFTVTEPENAIAYSKWVYLAANSDLLSDKTEQDRVRLIAEKRLAGRSSDSRDEANLSAEAAGLLSIFSATNSADFRTKLAATPQSFQKTLDGLSPSHYVDGLRAPLVLIHLARDPSIPAQQSIELAEVARARGIDNRLTLLQMYGHTYPTLPEPGFASIIHFYIPEAVRFLGVINHVIAIR